MQKSMCSPCSTLPLQYVLLMLTGLNIKSNKDQVINTIVYCMAKLSIKSSYSYVVISNLWLVF